VNSQFKTDKILGCLSTILILVISTNILHYQIINAQTQGIKKPPETRKEVIRDTLHDVEITDAYRWLEDQISAETRAWIEDQNRYTHTMLDELPYREVLQKRFAELMRIDRYSYPLERNGVYFYMRRKAEEEQWSLYFNTGMNSMETILLDPHLVSGDLSKSIHLQDVSPNGTILVYGIQYGGEDELQLRLFDVRTRRDLDDQLPKGVIYDLVFKNDNSGFYYSLFHRDIGPRLYFHKLGTDYEKDIKLFGDGIGAEDGLSLAASQDGNYILITVEHGWTKSDIYVLDARRQEPAKPVIIGLDGNFIPQMGNGKLYVQTDWKAPSGRIVSIDMRNQSIKDWKEIIPTGKDVITQFVLIRDKLVVHYLVNVSSKLKIFSLDGTVQGEVSLPGLCTVSNFSGAEKGTKLFFEVQSFNRPRTTYYYDFSTKESTIWSNDKVPIAPEIYTTKQVWYSSKDGTKIPMFLVHKKDLNLPDDHPTLLYGYGGFNISITPHFNPFYGLWIESGGIYAVANIRGGGEFGKEWHRGGILENKQNAIDDFISAAKWLIDNKYTDPEKLAIHGESNGGLLVGATLTQRPDLFKVVICEFPDLDIVGSPRFASNPAGMYEYGDASNFDDFQYIYKYSPYQNVQDGINYPAVLFITGDSDTRVPPLQARKMTARLQAASLYENPILLLYDTKSGHSGGKTLSEYVDLFSYKMSFLFWQLNHLYGG
jgi:prolyl oligopeptidase